MTLRSGALRPHRYPRGLTGAQTAVLSMQAMPENDGGWPVLTGGVSRSDLRLAIDEDTIGDAERSSALAEVGYLIVGPAGGAIPVTTDPGSATGLYREWLGDFYPQAVLNDPNLEGTGWGFGADGDGDGQPAGLEYTLGGDPSDAASTIEPFTITLEASGDVAVRYRYRSNDPDLSVTLLTSLGGQFFEAVTGGNAKAIETLPDGAFTIVTARFEPSAGGAWRHAALPAGGALRLRRSVIPRWRRAERRPTKCRPPVGARLWGFFMSSSASGE